MDQRPIGVFDSSVGGISVLRELTKLMPSERFIYYGDTINAPYGERTEDEILRLTTAAVERLLVKDIKALVIACNTATSAAASTLREQLSIPVIGMEPALKPAQQNHKDGLILVMATPATLRQPKFLGLLKQYGEHALPVPCPGLMGFVERGDLGSDALIQYLREKLTGYDRPVESIVLGCTHYVFLRDAIHGILPEAALYDGNEGTARHLRKLLMEKGQLNDAGEGEITLCTNGDEAAVLSLMEMLLGQQ